jgi:hypothetical protein
MKIYMLNLHADRKRNSVETRQSLLAANEIKARQYPLSIINES